MAHDSIVITGAREHNLKNISLTLPRDKLVVITGLSGAGRSTAAKSLEDLGWFVVDNLPPGLLPTMVDLAARSNGAVSLTSPPSQFSSVSGAKARWT